MCLPLQAIWCATPVEGGVRLSLTSPDGDQGYPGKVQVSVTYTLQVNLLVLKHLTPELKSFALRMINVNGKLVKCILINLLSTRALFYHPTI